MSEWLMGRVLFDQFARRVIDACDDALERIEQLRRQLEQLEQQDDAAESLAKGSSAHRVASGPDGTRAAGRSTARILQTGFSRI